MNKSQMHFCKFICFQFIFLGHTKDDLARPIYCTLLGGKSEYC